eukprot:13302398-Alexandrium_andersonii.AAC.1
MLDCAPGGLREESSLTRSTTAKQTWQRVIASRCVCADPPQLGAALGTIHHGADQPRQRILSAGIREVSGDDERSLLAEIADGAIPKPELLEFNDWTQWRKGPGRRP